MISGIFLYMFLRFYDTDRDPLTGLRNRMSFYADCKRYGQLINAVASVDMNGLKELNDTKGHEAGDKALQAIADSLKDVAGRRIMVYRIGGDEFIILFIRQDQIVVSDVMHRSESERLLILIDEPARTTNPVEGKALVQAIATIMGQRDSITMITTHYSQLGVNCRRLRVRGFVESLSDMPITAQTINRFIDYSLILDNSDEVPHEALRIAELLNCHPELIRQAKQFLLP